ncbi:CHASE3 domain-containing protein [Jannaschia sp. Os4]|uniref:sensor histidine kinase n=1 Tax=Jannaschia sp. Os4 TaxID=2807617 RepID=UPI00193A80B1|nr:CHASE3 domain-containing protein [Jannaschia sp. Os4]MBM2576970.1 CHASE3 domain-containing protein [Jannaschia sp. Os4]
MILPSLTSPRVVIAALCLLLAAGATVVAMTVSAERAARAQVTRTAAILEILRGTLRDGLDAETGQRGYLLTDDVAYLEPYERAAGAWLGRIDVLEARLGEEGIEDAQIAILQRMRRIAEAKLAELAATIDLATSGARDDALALVRTDEGRTLMTEFRAEVEALERMEQDLLAREVAAAERIERRTVPALALLGLVALLLSMVGLRVERRTAAAEARAREADDLRAARARSDLLAREMDHRVKNLLAVVLSIVSLSAKGAAPEARPALKRLRERLHGLSLAHSAAQEQDARGGVALGTLVDRTLAPYRDGTDGRGGPRIATHGPPIHLPVSMVTPLGLVLHELATNAVKHGALSHADGRLDLGWETVEDGSAVRLTWRESGSPGARPPVRTGFGSVLLTQSARQLRAKLDQAWPGDGLRVDLRVPLPPRDAAGPAARTGRA